jgi:hypothetical protein
MGKASILVWPHSEKTVSAVKTLPSLSGSRHSLRAALRRPAVLRERTGQTASFSSGVVLTQHGEVLA